MNISDLLYALRPRLYPDIFAPAASYGKLDHAIERSVLMAQGETVKSGDLGLRTTRDAAPRLEEMSLEEVECSLIKKALARYDGNVSHAAKALGLSRSALYRRLQRFGL